MALDFDGDVWEGIVHNSVRLLGSRGEVLAILKPVAPASGGCITLQGTILKEGVTGSIKTANGMDLGGFSDPPQSVLPGQVAAKTLCVET